MTAPEVFQVRDGDDWEVYVTNPAGGWWLLGDVGGTAVVNTLPDGAEEMVSREVIEALGSYVRILEKRINEILQGGDRRG